MQFQPVIESVSVDALIPYINNARTHNEQQVSQIAASIKEFGWTNPILTDGDNGVIAGHGRLLAAKKLGMTEVPCIELSHLTDIQKKALILADNKLALNAGWDDKLLAIELGELKEAGFDLFTAGFSDEDMQELDIDGIGDGEKESVLDQLGVTIAEPRNEVERYDRWLLGGRHVLICTNIINEWEYWVHELGDDDLLLPYAGIYSALSKKAEDQKLVIIQPDQYIAGYILDRYQDAHGMDSIQKTGNLK